MAQRIASIGDLLELDEPGRKVVIKYRNRGAATWQFARTRGDFTGRGVNRSTLRPAGTADVGIALEGALGFGSPTTVLIAFTEDTFRYGGVAIEVATQIEVDGLSWRS